VTSHLQGVRVLAFQIRELERQTSGDFKHDATVTVVDAKNFTGYEDTPPTAKMQASHTVTDVIPIVRFLSSQSPNTEFTIIVRQNEWEHVSEQALGFVLDHNTSNDLTPKI
jgi:hypothetical protein